MPESADSEKREPWCIDCLSNQPVLESLYSGESQRFSRDIELLCDNRHEARVTLSPRF